MNILKFINKTKTPFIPLYCTLNENEKKEYYGFPSTYKTFSYTDSKQHAKYIDFEPNHILIKVPSDVVVFDTDGITSYNELTKYLRANNLYIEENTTTSFSGNALNLHYKKHFYFKCLSSETEAINNYLGGATKLEKFDIFNNSWGIGENLENIINYGELQYITLEQTKHILKLFKPSETSSNATSETSSNATSETSSTTPSNTSTDTSSDTDDMLHEILNNLDPERFNNYGLDDGIYSGGWFKLACIFINENFNIDILEQASMKSNKYNKRNNQTIYNYIRRTNYTKKPATMASLKNMIKKDNPSIYQKLFLKNIEFLDLKDDLKVNQFDEVKKIDNTFLYTTDTDEHNILNYKNFSENETIIIESTTGTGKTSATAAHLHEYILGEYTTLQNKDLKFLSITPREILTEQHIHSFKNVGCIKYKNNRGEKRENKILWNSKAVSMCVNSILTYSKFDLEEFKNYIIYIDEINSFLHYLTHSETLNKNLKEVYELLKKMVNNCHKLIVSDAHIMNNVLLFLENRKTNKFYIRNNFKKYEGVNAFFYPDETAFLNKLKENVENNHYFFMGCDEKKISQRYYHECKNMAKEEQKKNFVLITADEAPKITNATEQFKNKFVFYSPKMVYGVDFNNIETAQDVFIYIKGMTITPSESFQQATRTRNIKNLYFHGVDKNKEVRFKTLNEVEDFYKTHIELSQKLNLISKYLNEKDEQIIYESSFFKLYCYNEYIRHVYKSNKIKHFEEILKQFGFNVETVGESKKLDKQKKKMMELTLKTFETDFINKFIEDNDKDKPEYEEINKRVEILKLSTVEQMKTYSQYLCDGKLVLEHFNRIDFLRTDAEINMKFNTVEHNNYKIKTVKNLYHKIKLIRQLEDTYDINITNEIINNNTTAINFDDNLYKLIAGVFKTEKKKPTKFNEVVNLYISMVKHIDENLIISKQLMTKENRKKTKHQLSYKILHEDLKLNQLRKPYLNHIKNIDNLIIKCNETTIDPIIINNDDVNNTDDFIDNFIDVAASIELTSDPINENEPLIEPLNPLDIIIL